MAPHLIERSLAILAIASAVFFVASILAIPYIIARLPADFFVRPAGTTRRTPGRVVLHILRQCAGIVLLCAGIAMLFLPGQGLLTILFGVVLLDFPGKRTLVTALLARPEVRKGIDWIRVKYRKPPMDMPPAPK